MAKEIVRKLKLTIPAGQATPTPPIGPALSPYGVNTHDFCTQFNDKTRSAMGIMTPVIITVYKDRTFSLEIKNPSVSELIKRTIDIEKGSGTPNTKKVGKISRLQIVEIANKKKGDFNTEDIEKISKIVEGTARQMGIDVVE